MRGRRCTCRRVISCHLVWCPPSPSMCCWFRGNGSHSGIGCQGTSARIGVPYEQLTIVVGAATLRLGLDGAAPLLPLTVPTGRGTHRRCSPPRRLRSVTGDPAVAVKPRRLRLPVATRTRGLRAPAPATSGAVGAPLRPQVGRADTLDRRPADPAPRPRPPAAVCAPLRSGPLWAVCRRRAGGRRRF
jgi:hypothetical protein